MKNRGVILFVLGLLIVPAMASAQSWSRGRYHEKPSWGGWHYDGGYYRHDRNFYTGFGWGRFGDGAIQRGVYSGKLSNAEVRELYREKADFERKQSRYLSDGWLTRKEREDLQDERQDFRKKLNHELQDGERRWGAKY